MTSLEQDIVIQEDNYSAVAKKPEEKQRSLRQTLEGECPIRCAILYKGLEEWEQWLSWEQRGHMKRIDISLQNPILRLLNEKLDQRPFSSTENNRYLIVRFNAPPYNLIVISTHPLNEQTHPAADPLAPLASVCLELLADLTKSNETSKEAIIGFFNDLCTLRFNGLIFGDKKNRPIEQPFDMDLNIVSRQMLPASDLDIASRSEQLEPEPRQENEESNKRRCSIL